MTRGDLRRLILKHEGELPCLRLHRRPDGTIVTRSCFAPVLRAGRFLRLKAGLAAVAFWSTVFAFWSWARRPAQTVIDGHARAETETRKLPFVIKPPAEPAASTPPDRPQLTREAGVRGPRPHLHRPENQRPIGRARATARSRGRGRSTSRAARSRRRRASARGRRG